MNKIIIFSAFYAVTSVLGTAIIKDKLLHSKIIGFHDFIVFLFDIKIFVAAFFIFISLFFTVKVLSLASFSSVIPFLTAIHFIITIAVGVLYFKDNVSMLSYAGIILILCGVFLIAKGYANN